MVFTRRYRRRVSKKPSVTKVKYQRPTASNQKRQILKNTKAVVKIAKQIKSRTIYTDYHFTDTYTVPPGGWLVRELNNCVDNWIPWGRVSENAAEATKSYLQSYKCYFGCYGTGPAVSRLHIFLVTPTVHQASRNPMPTAAGGGGDPAFQSEYITSQDGATVLTLNSSVFKVVKHKTVTLTISDPGSALPTTIPADWPGNPNTTYRHVYLDSKAGFNIKYPVGVIGSTYDGVPWRKTPQTYLPYYHRVYLMMFCETENTNGVSVYMHNRIQMMNPE